MQNLHVDENAYIAIFLIHHSKDIRILEEIELNAMCFFDKYEPASLTKDNVKFFDKQVDMIIKASLPPTNITPEKERHKMLKCRDKQEEREIIERDNSEDPLGKDLRRAIRTAEVIGAILKNRGGSLKKAKSEELFEVAMNIHLRILSSFFDIIKDENTQKSMIEFISKALKDIISENKSKNKNKLCEEKLRKEARRVFWNLNFFIAYGVINKIAHSLGSDKLIELVENVYKRSNSPAVFLVKEKISMWYLKNIKVDEILKRINKKDFSEIAKKVMRFMIVEYSTLHPINYKDRQKLANKLSIPMYNLLVQKHS